MVQHSDIDHTGITGAGGGAVATDAIWDAKGDLAGGTGANTAAKLTAGANGTILSADSAQSTGLAWITPAPPVVKRQGGDASDWSVVGTTTYTPGVGVVMQGGVFTAKTQADGTVTVTFPQTFTNKPLVLISVGEPTVDGTNMSGLIIAVTATNFTFNLTTAATATGQLHWLAIGI